MSNEQTFLEIMAQRQALLIGFAALCVVLGFVLCLYRMQHQPYQGEISANLGKCSLILKQVHAGPILIVFGVCVALFLICKPPKYSHTRSSDGGEETHTEVMKATENLEMAGSPMPKESKAK